MELYLRHHRGITTSIFTMIPFCLLLAYVFNRLSGKKSFQEFFCISLAAFSSHIFLDLITSFGTMVLYPLSQRRFALDLLFILDFILTGILLLTLILSRLWRERAARICRAGLVLSLIYISFCALQHQRAYRLGQQFAEQQGLNYSKLASLPQPFSPLRWANLIQTKDKIYQGLVDFAQDDAPPQTNPARPTWQALKVCYDPPGRIKYKAWDRLLPSPWVERALATDGGARFFYWFARFPIVRRVYEEQGRYRVELFDLRFCILKATSKFIYRLEFEQPGRLVRQGFVYP